MKLPQNLKISVEKTDPDILKRAAEILRAGGVIAVPTDTAYAFAANGLDVSAVERVFALKSRNLEKAFHVIVADVEMGTQFAIFNRAAHALAQAFLPGALTLILPRTEIVPDRLVGGLPTLGLRMPAHPYCLELARITGLPLTATSANISGMPTPYSVETIREQLGERMGELDLVLDQGEIPYFAPSTLVDAAQLPVRILRQGPVSQEAIYAALEQAGIPPAAPG